MQLLTQLCSPSVFLLNGNKKTLWLRLNQTAKTLHSVNVNRFRALEEEFEVNETVLVAYRILCEKLDEYGSVGFPEPLEI
jgi:hypothetical protein